MSASSADAKRSWRGAPRGVIVRRSRNIWRWLLSGLALCLIGLAVYWAWPRPVSRTLLLVLSGDREERTTPLVPYVAGDCQAMLAWAAAANVPACERQLLALASPAAIGQWLRGGSASEKQLIFRRQGKAAGEYRPGNNDRLVIYIKGHGLALDVGDGDTSDVRPVLIKSLSENDLGGPWYRDEAHVIDVAALLQELAKLANLQTLVMLDVVHVNYDPRLGTVVNAFPQALKQAVEKLPQLGNLAVIVGQGDGELAVATPGAGRSALIDSFVTVLERQQDGPAAIPLEAFVDKLQNHLSQLSKSGRGSFSQTVQRILMPASSSRLADFALPTSAPAEEDGVKTKDQQAAAVASAVKSEAERAVPIAAEVTTLAQKASSAIPGQSSVAATPSENNPTAANQPPTSGAQAPVVSPAAPPPAPANAAPKTNLEIAWGARDSLRERYRTGWTPVHVAPQQWRRVEAVLAGFDEELLPPGQTPRDPQTLADITRDLQKLAAYFDGQRELPSGEDCRTIAESLERFLAGPAVRSFQPRQAGALDEANDALKVFAEGLYRAYDYLRLHGQMATVLDGGPFLNDASLDSLLTKLNTLRGLLTPAGLADGRLTEPRLRELSRVAREVDRERERVDEDIAAYAKSTAAAEPSPGKLLRARLLLHSPVLAADIRRSLRGQSSASLAAASESISATPASFGQRLASNARLTAKLLEIAVPVTTAGASLSKRSSSGADLGPLDSKAEPLGWAALGKRLRGLSQEWPNVINAGYEARVGSRSALAAPDSFDLYRLSLLVDGRDAQRSRPATLASVALAQLLLPPRVLDQVELAFSPERLQLPPPGADGAPLQLSLQVISENPPPYTATLDLKWDANQITVLRPGDATPLRNGPIALRLDSNKLTFPLQIRARRESRDGNTAILLATGRFATSPPTSQQLACVLPRPDLVELTLAGDDNLEAARRRTWLPSSQQGGRLRLFPNREKSFIFYLANQSSEDKRLIARLYRVPRAAVDPSGRLFDPRSPSQLLAATAGFDARLAQPGTESSQILRGQLIAQTNEKEPLLLPANQTPVKVPLAANAATPPAAPPLAAGAKAADESKDTTSGLVLVLTPADGKGKPYVKWIELQTHQPDDLLEIKEPLYREGRLSFRVGLKDPALVEEMGLAKQPLALVWDTQPPPPEVRVLTKEGLIGTEGEPIAEFTSSVAANITWPIFLHLHTDRDPRGLVASLAWRGPTPILDNFKENHPPVVHISRVGAAAERSGAPPEKIQALYRPDQPWLPFPSTAAIAEGLPLVPRGQPLLVRVDGRTPTVRLDCDFGADVAPRLFSEGGRLRVSVDGRSQQFALDRQVAARCEGIEDGAIRLSSQVADFQAIDLGPLDVPQDRRVNLVAEIASETAISGTASSASDAVTIVLDRTPPVVTQPFAERSPRASPTPDAPPPTVIAMQCRADDGAGSGISKVEFVVGFDLNNNDRLDEPERRPAVRARRVAEGAYAAEYSLSGDSPGERLLMEATATDNVQQASPPTSYLLLLRRSIPAGGQRTTFGGKKIEPEVPPGKKNKGP